MVSFNNFSDIRQGRLRSWLISIARVFRVAFVYDHARFMPNGLLAAFVIATLMTAAATIWLRPYDFSELKEKGLAPDGHVLYSLEMAANNAFCGKYSQIYRNPAVSKGPAPKPSGLREVIGQDPSLVDESFRSIIKQQFAPVDSYCATEMRPFLNNENLLFAGYSLALKLVPDASLLDLATIATTVRLVLIGFVAFAMIVLGFGVVWAVLPIVLGIEIHLLTIGTHVLSIYPYMVLQLAALVAGLALGVPLATARGLSLRFTIIFGILVGAALFAIWHMRTAHGMVAAAVVVLFLLLLFLSAHGRPALDRYVNRVAVLAITIPVSALMLNWITFADLPYGNDHNRSFHVIAHPLVLGLAVPPNNLAEREQIKWDDMTGLEIARRIDPNATYIGPTYEVALFKYYFGLWKNYPGEMLSVYQAKFHAAGREMQPFVSKHMSLLAKSSFLPIRWLLVSGWLWISFLVATVFVGSYAFVKFRHAAGLVAALCGSAGFLLMLEHAIILPTFAISHFGGLLELTFLISIGLMQVASNAMALAVKRSFISLRR